MKNLYFASPTERIAYETTFLWDKFCEKSPGAALKELATKIDVSKEKIKQRNRFWAKIKKDHKPS